jgi:hypothetical protein
VKIIPIESEEDFKKLVDSWTPPADWDKPEISFRGEINASWKLQSLLERKAKDKFGDSFLQYIADFEVTIIDQFIERCVRLELRDIYPGNKLPESSETWQWLSLLQHYKHPTRLIDFTDDLWIALSFALENPDPQIPFAIYALPLNGDDDSGNKLPRDANDKVYRVALDQNKINTNELLALVLKFAGCVGIKQFLPYQATTLANEWRNPKKNYGWDTPAISNPRKERQRGRFLYQLWLDGQIEQIAELTKYEIAAKLRPAAMEILHSKGHKYTKDYLFPTFEQS